MKQLRFFLVLGFALCLFAVPFAAFAQSGKSVVVKQRDADITILENGDVQVAETWVVDFQNGPFTFAFREIPKSKLRDITAWGVREGDREFQAGSGAYAFQLDDATDKYKITWHFPATNQGANYLSDTHTFELTYTLRGAMRIYPQGDQFWWKFIESDRVYPIESSRVTIHLPTAFSPEQIKTSAYVNSDETGGGRIVDAQTLEFIGGPFPPKMEWELRAQFPHVINAAPEAWQVEDDRIEQIAAQNNVYATIAFVVILFGGPLLLLVLWFVLGRDKPTTFDAEFLPAPPDDTPPGVVGTLLDERADLQDILATVAHLAQRGFLRIREGDGFGSPIYERTAKPETDLALFEKATLDALLGSAPARKLDEVRGTFYYRLKDLKNALYDEVVVRGYFPSSPLATRDFYFRLGKWGAILLPLIGFATACFTIVFAPMAFLPMCGLEVMFLALLGLSRFMPQRTAKGAQAAAQWQAFRRYLANLEKYGTLGSAQDKFSEYLPYTIAFGLEETWIEKFKQTNASAPKWYIPYTGETDASTWRDVGSTGHSSSSAPSVFSAPASASPSAPDAPLFRDSAADQSAAPNLDAMARGSFVGLNRVSSNMFSFLNSSASAFTEEPPRTSAAESVMGGIGDVIDWIGSSSGSSSSGSSWSSSSSSSSWSGGGSSGGGGGGGGSSGFG